ncbi:LamG-like jellyroll fold domain-containing protein [Seonamhaeicola sp. ML3]|uniref:LamG-like jellyroll fold domain-containing protein n=1 Tax=Seonamhaeicola sp. ML3 TaxID=2937786 RepID=UPI00200D89A7|nr:LamG-like jellyroll fold domain-containing protein [Seonamhaeicola sp. ML3]
MNKVRSLTRYHLLCLFIFTYANLLGLNALDSDDTWINNSKKSFCSEDTKHKTFESAATITETKFAVSFNGENQYLDAGNVNGLINTSYTISAWIKRNTNNNELDIISKNNGDYGYALRISNSNKLNFVWRNKGDDCYSSLIAPSEISENVWHHVAVTFNRNTNALSLFINGELKAQDQIQKPILVETNAHFLIGASHDLKNKNCFNGSIDEVRIWNLDLKAEQIRYIMNQEIEACSSVVNGKILPFQTTKNEIASISWEHLISYYSMNTLVLGKVKDESNNGHNASLVNIDHLENQTAPLPYKTIENGDWNNPNTWLNGNIQCLPGKSWNTESTDAIGFNIVEINNNINLKTNKSVLGLIINKGRLNIGDTTEGANNTKINVSHYLKLDGIINLKGKSELVQGAQSDFESTSNSAMEINLQGTSNTFTYNYWSSPVSVTSNSSHTASSVITNVGFITSGYNGTASPIQNADYWIWKYAHDTKNNQSQWQHIRSTGPIQPGEGFTMKGPGTSNPYQDYTFSGQPNNGDINLSIAKDNDYLIGNPYPSVIDANTFLKDNLSTTEGGNNTNGNIINGALYFFDHFMLNTHLPGEYQGGYGMYTLMGSTQAINKNTRINFEGSPNLKTPGRFIPIGQGFFVSSKLKKDTDENTLSPKIPQEVSGGAILFQNNQRSLSSTIEDNREKIKLIFDSPNGYYRQLLVGVDEKASNNFDIGYDGVLIEDNNEDAFWVMDSEKLIIQAVNNFSTNQILPLGLKISKQGNGVFKIDNLSNIPNNLDVLIHDKELKEYHSLREGLYTVNLSPGEYLNRFEITFKISSQPFENEETESDNQDTSENDTTEDSDDEVVDDNTENDEAENNTDETSDNDNNTEEEGNNDPEDSNDTTNEEDNNDTTEDNSRDDETIAEDIDNNSEDNTENKVETYYSNNKTSVIIENPGLKYIDNIRLVNILGQTIYEFSLNNNMSFLELKTRHLNTGNYILQLTTKDEIITKKVLIK